MSKKIVADQLRLSWPVWSAVANRLHICFFDLETKILGIWGPVIDRWKDFENTFPMVNYKPQKS